MTKDRPLCAGYAPSRAVVCGAGVFQLRGSRFKPILFRPAALPGTRRSVRATRAYRYGFCCTDTPLLHGHAALPPRLPGPLFNYTCSHTLPNSFSEFGRPKPRTPPPPRSMGRGTVFDACRQQRPISIARTAQIVPCCREPASSNFKVCRAQSVGFLSRSRVTALQSNRNPTCLGSKDLSVQQLVYRKAFVASARRRSEVGDRALFAPTAMHRNGRGKKEPCV